MPADLLNLGEYLPATAAGTHGWEPPDCFWTTFDTAKGVVMAEWRLARTACTNWSHALVFTADIPSELVFWGIIAHLI